MRIGAMIDGGKSIERVVGQVRNYADRGFATAWCSQVFAHDALTLFAAIGPQAPGIELGTAVVPVYGRHPQVLAQQALTVQAATGSRLQLGIGLSHQVVIEGLWGLSYDRPGRYMREYLAALLPLLDGKAVSFTGEVVTATTYAPLEIPGSSPPPVLIAALGPIMLKMAGELASGTVTWMTGARTIASHVAPTIVAAAQAAGRPAPRVVVALPVAVTERVEQAKAAIDEALAIYPDLPSYRAMLDKEGAEKPSDIALVGTEEVIAEGLRRLSEAGCTDFVADVSGSRDSRALTLDLLGELAKA